MRASGFHGGGSQGAILEGCGECCQACMLLKDCWGCWGGFWRYADACLACVRMMQGMPRRRLCSIKTCKRCTPRVWLPRSSGSKTRSAVQRWQACFSTKSVCICCSAGFTDARARSSQLHACSSRTVPHTCLLLTLWAQGLNSTRVGSLDPCEKPASGLCDAAGRVSAASWLAKGLHSPPPVPEVLPPPFFSDGD